MLTEKVLKAILLNITNKQRHYLNTKSVGIRQYVQG
jgi:hypothetical protein